jgi:hypothetical protein
MTFGTLAVAPGCFFNQQHMKIKDTFDLQDLAKHGFFRVTKEKCEEENIDHEDFGYWHWMKIIDYSRRGQFYCYLLNESTRNIHLIATNPNGGGAAILMDDTLIQLKEAGAI